LSYYLFFCVETIQVCFHHTWILFILTVSAAYAADSNGSTLGDTGLAQPAPQSNSKSEYKPLDEVTRGAFIGVLVRGVSGDFYLC